MYRGKKMTTQNPYGATTLEWTSPIEHIHGNWPGELPTTHRWAYEYGKDGVEFVPQTTPLKEGEIDGGGH
jgi:cytochrome c oxidase subunit 1